MSRIIKSAIAIAAAIAPAALAESGSSQSSMPVAYRDLDLASATGGKVLLNRIKGAARKACGNVTTRSPLKPRAIATCSRETVASTVRQLDIGSLTLAWSEKYPVTELAAR
ncbi:MAG: UrcA family protein [Alphaproteobacteria bacterium]|nr:UrcA family protein [Alphaproteobacteria bacterium]